jgi:MFS family permease
VRRFDAYKIYMSIGAIGSVAFGMIFSMLAIYYVQNVGMNPLQLVLVGTALEATILLFETPTGVVADLYSRRVSVIIAYALIGLCYVAQGIAPIFAAILAAEIVRGIGETFLSGALNAWATDELGEERIGRAFLRYGQVQRIGRFVGLGLGVALGSIALHLPLLAGGAIILGMSIFLLFAMPEQGFVPAPRAGRSTLQEALAVTREGIGVARRQPIVLMFLIIGVIFGAFSEGFDRLWEAHFLMSIGLPDAFGMTPVVWIGILNAGAALVGLFTVEVIIRRLDTRNTRTLSRMLLVTTALLIVTLAGFGLAPNVALAALCFWIASACRAIHYPLADIWLARVIPSRVRATVLSLLGQSDALGQVAGGPVVGLVGLRSLRAALLFSALLLSPALALYGRRVRLEGDGSAEVAAQAAPIE